MSASAKIDKLLELTSPPPERREIARKNYYRLLEKEGEAALDGRISEFEAIRDDIASWRNHRNARHSSPAILDRAAARNANSAEDFLVREKLLARRLETQVDLLNQLRVTVRDIDYEQFRKNLRRAGLDVTNTHQHPPLPFIVNYFARILYAIVGRSQTTSLAFHTKTLEELLQQIEHRHQIAIKRTSSRIETDQMILGLGRMAGYVTEMMPDAIFTLNEGGDTIGKFIDTHLKLGVPIIALQGNGKKGITQHPHTCIPRHVFRPLIVDDIARSGGTVTSACDWISHRFPAASTRAVTVAASIEAIGQIGSDIFMTLNPTESGTIELPYNPKAGFASNDENYIFGAEASTLKERLSVPIDIVTKVTAEQSFLVAQS